MSLARLHNDALKEVFAYLDVEDLLQLYCCGYGHFVTLFNHIVLTRVLLRSQVRYMYGRIPQFVVAFGRFLSHFEIRTTNALAEFPLCTQRAIKALSPDLRTLVICTPEAEQILTEVDVAELAELHSLFNSRSHTSQTLSHWQPKLINLAKRFPHLENLTVSSCNNDSDYTLHAADLFVLPPHLRLLRWISPQFDDSLFDYLPASLTSLAVGGGITLASHPSFPPSLQHFFWDRNNIKSQGQEALLPDAALSSLPKGLYEFGYLSRSLHCLQPHQYALLPPKLSLLQVPRITLTEMVTFPSHLQELQVSLNPPLHGTHMFGILPAKLTHLDIKLINSDARDLDFSTLPSTLRTLIVRNGGRFQAPLPPSLTHFTQVSVDPGISLMEIAWPPTISTIILCGPLRHPPSKNPAKSVSIDIINDPLPLSLRSLTVTAIYSGDLTILPPSLTELITTISEIPTAFHLLPRSLTHLSAFHVRHLNTFMINSLPRGLKRFTVVSSGDTSSLDLSLSQWPPSLLSINLNVGLNDTFSKAEDVLALPPSLTLLKWSGGFAASLVQHLPATLTSFEIDRIVNECELQPVQATSSLPSWTSVIPSFSHLQGSIPDQHGADLSSCIRFLPRNLRFLRISRGPQTPIAWEMLPRSLTSVSLPSKLFPSSFHLISPKINSFFFGDGAFERYTGPYDRVTRTRNPPGSTPIEDDNSACIIS